MSAQPVPSYREADFERILARDFGDAAGHARSVLGEYGSAASHPESLRVRMACLKLADGDIERLKHHVRNACADYRDVLAWAEYPAYTSAEGRAEQERAIRSDWERLQQWLAKP